MSTFEVTARRFWLGSFDGERLFVYDALGHVPTIAAALAKQPTRPHTHLTDVLIEEQDFATNGIVWGGGKLLRSVIDGAILPSGRLGAVEDLDGKRYDDAYGLAFEQLEVLGRAGGVAMFTAEHTGDEIAMRALEDALADYGMPEAA